MWETYATSNCEGEPYAIYAGKQLCNGGFIDSCDATTGILTAQGYNSDTCAVTDGTPVVYNKDECKMVRPGKFQKASCYFKGQTYWKPNSNK